MLLVESKLLVATKIIGQGLLVIFLLFTFTIFILHVLICFQKKKKNLPRRQRTPFYLNPKNKLSTKAHL